MKEYHKIQTVFLRDPETKFKRLLEGQWATHEFAYLADNDWLWTEKVDGTNIRVMFDGEQITFGGKTDTAQIPATLVKVLQDQFLGQVERFKAHFPDGVTLYGEGYGAKIQSGGNYQKDQAFVLFDVLIGGFWLRRGDVADVASVLGVEIVPIVGGGNLHDMITFVKMGFKSRWGDFMAEGIVARPLCELRARNGDRIITKIKHKDFV